MTWLKRALGGASLFPHDRNPLIPHETHVDGDTEPRHCIFPNSNGFLVFCSKGNFLRLVFVFSVYNFLGFGCNPGVQGTHGVDSEII